MAGLYLVLVVLLNIPAVQHYIGSQIADALSDKLGTRVYVGNVDLGMLNRIIIDDVLVNDLSDKEMTRIAQEQLASLGMEPFMAKNVKQLSGGQKQRVAIARALVNQPDMIVADEPTGSLDSQSQEIVLEVFKSLAKSGKTVLIVTHNPEVAEYADVIIKMKDGEVVEEVKK